MRKALAAVIMILWLGLAASPATAAPKPTTKPTAKTVSFQTAAPGDVDFPYSVNGLLLLSFSTSVVLIASGVGMKVLFARK